MNKKEILKILEKAVDENGDIPMRLVRQAFDKLPEECDDTVSRDDVRKAIRDFYDGECIASEEFEHKYLSRIPQKLPPVIPKSYSEYRSKIPMEHYEIDLPPTVRDDAVSRKAVYALLLKKDCDWDFSQELINLPPVTQTLSECDDVVSRQAAIDAMCMACGHDCDKSKFVYNAPQGEQVIMCPEHYALSTLPSAQPEPQWIPVSERLPEHSYGMSFLVTVKFDDGYKKVMICEWSSFHKSEDAFEAPKKLNINGFTYWVYQPVPMDRVIAWMPLPEPYREERRTDERTD